jgi:hypothetical protein
MSASTFEFVTRMPQAPRRARADRRTKSRLRELCDEVLASYRIAQGQDLLSDEDRQVAEQVLRKVTPKL